MIKHFPLRFLIKYTARQNAEKLQQKKRSQKDMSPLKLKNAGVKLESANPVTYSYLYIMMNSFVRLALSIQEMLRKHLKKLRNLVKMDLSLLSNKPKRLCTIDASTQSIAFAIFEDEQLKSYGKIRFDGTRNYDKVADAAKKCVQLFKQFNIDAIVIEHTIYLNSPKTAADLALVQGAILGAAAQNKIKISGSINPIAWQTFIGNGKFTKEAKLAMRKEIPGKSDSWYKNHERDVRKQKTINFVNINYDLDINDNDVADAIGIGHYAIRNWGKVDK